MGLSYLQFPIWKLEIERPELAECDRVQLAVDYLWFAKIAIGIQIKELTDPVDFVCARMILGSCCAC